MLVEDNTISQVALGPRGLCQTQPKGAIHLVMGTHGVAVVPRRNAAALVCPPCHGARRI